MNSKTKTFRAATSTIIAVLALAVILPAIAGCSTLGGRKYVWLNESGEVKTYRPNKTTKRAKSICKSIC